MSLFRRKRPEQRDKVAQLRAALQRLPDEQREAYTSVAISGLTIAEAAERSHVHDETMEQRLVEALVGLVAEIDKTDVSVGAECGGE